MNRDRASLRVFGMDCAEEVSLLRRELSRVRGIFDLTFDVVAGRLNVQYDPSMTSQALILEAIAHTGMRAEPWRENGGAASRDNRGVAAAISGIALSAAAALQAETPLRFLLALLIHDEHHGPISAPVLACYLVAIAAGVFYSLPKAWRALRSAHADMNVLMAVSISGAAWLGEWSEAATVAFLFSLANLLESWSLARARRAIGSLLRVAPAEAEVKHGDHVHRVAVENIRPDSIVLVRPGDRIPCDGEILSGESRVDQAILTGESVAVPKGPGDSVYAGTLNTTGLLEVRTTRPYRDSTMARILRMVEESQARRAPSEQWVERFARVYTPVTIGLAFLVGVLPPLLGFGTLAEWLYQSMVVLLISCPCALVISTPVTVLAALTSASRRGVLIKGGAFLEMAARIDAIAFDKTGVLTDGEFQIQTIQPANGHTDAEILSCLAGLEQRNEHPVARSLVREARRRGAAPVEAKMAKNLAGRGSEAAIGGQLFWAGNARAAEERSLIAAGVDELERNALTVVACGSEESVHGLVALQDHVRPEAKWSLQDLRRLGVSRLVMLTGDNEAVARSVAAQVGLDEVHAGLAPEEKAGQVRNLRRTFPRVAMVGDGINDTPALAAAALGITFGGKSADVALETADVVLMREDLRLLPFLLAHAQRTLRVIQQNVGAALLLKLLFLALAIAGHATLWMAIVADMGATLLVIFNGLRLLRAR